MQAHGGRVVALGKFREAAAGDIKPRSVMILVEWASKAAFDSYCNDPKIADLHPHREKGVCDRQLRRPHWKWTPIFLSSSHTTLQVRDG
jgi:uncharacterized protein (DUF1330 family)